MLTFRSSAEGPKVTAWQGLPRAAIADLRLLPQADVSMGIPAGAAASNPLPLGQNSRGTSEKAKSLTILDISGPPEIQISARLTPTDAGEINSSGDRGRSYPAIP